MARPREGSDRPAGTPDTRSPAQNARRHGFTAKAPPTDRRCLMRIDRIVRALCGDGASAPVRAAAKEAATAQIVLEDLAALRCRVLGFSSLKVSLEPEPLTVREIARLVDLMNRFQTNRLPKSAYRRHRLYTALLFKAFGPYVPCYPRLAIMRQLIKEDKTLARLAIYEDRTRRRLQRALDRLAIAQESSSIDRETTAVDQLVGRFN